MRLIKYFQNLYNRIIKRFKQVWVKEIFCWFIRLLPKRCLQQLAQLVAMHRPLTPWPNWKCNDIEIENYINILREEILKFVQENKFKFFINYRFQPNVKVRINLIESVGRNLFLSGCWEPNSFVYLDRVLKPGMAFLDVGANFGLYMAWAARRVGIEGLVIAFEPSKREFVRLEQNARLNRLKNVRLLNIGASDSRRLAQLHISYDYEPGLNTLGDFIYPDVTEADVATVQLDKIDNVLEDLKVSHVDIAKIDVEGHELFALKGMQSTLVRYHPLLLVEVEEATLQKQGCTVAQLFDILTVLGYQGMAFDPLTGLPIPVSATSQWSGNEIVWVFN